MGGPIGIMDREARFGRILLRLDSKGCETWLPIGTTKAVDGLTISALISRARSSALWRW
jgi:hypothetical protein